MMMHLHMKKHIFCVVGNPQHFAILRFSVDVSSVVLVFLDFAAAGALTSSGRRLVNHKTRRALEAGSTIIEATIFVEDEDAAIMAVQTLQAEQLTITRSCKPFCRSWCR